MPHWPHNAAIIVLQTFSPIQVTHDSCHWILTGIEFAITILTCKALFPWFPVLLKTLKGSNFAILLNKQGKNLPLSLNTALWLDLSFYALRSRSTSNWMPWFNFQALDIRELFISEGDSQLIYINNIIIITIFIKKDS